MARSRAVCAALLAAVVGIGCGGHVARSYQVAKVIDGDTIIVRDATRREQTVRLLGINTPEVHHPTLPVQCFGPEAAEFTRQQLSGKTVMLGFDVVRDDVYGRTLAHVYLDGYSFNEVLLRNGFARLLIIPPNVDRSRRYLKAEIAAKQEGLGLWSSCE